MYGWCHAFGFFNCLVFLIVWLVVCWLLLFGCCWVVIGNTDFMVVVPTAPVLYGIPCTGILGSGLMFGLFSRVVLPYAARRAPPDAVIVVYAESCSIQ